MEKQGELNFNKTIVSIIELFLGNEYDKLNSMKEYSNQYNPTCEQGSELKKKFSQQGEKMILKILTGGRDLGMTKQLIFIDNIYETDLIKWFKEFEHITERNNWNPFMQLKTLKMLIRDKQIIYKFLSENYEQNKNIIFRIVYPPETIADFIHKKTDIQQSSTIFIEDYYKHVKDKVKIYDFHAKCSEIELKRLEEEIFIAGLGKNTIETLIDREIKGLESIYKELQKLQGEIISYYRIPYSLNCQEILNMLSKKFNTSKTHRHFRDYHEILSNHQTFLTTKPNNTKTLQTLLLTNNDLNTLQHDIDTLQHDINTNDIIEIDTIKTTKLHTTNLDIIKTDSQLKHNISNTNYSDTNEIFTTAIDAQTRDFEITPNNILKEPVTDKPNDKIYIAKTTDLEILTTDNILDEKDNAKGKGVSSLINIAATQNNKKDEERPNLSMVVNQPRIRINSWVVTAQKLLQGYKYFKKKKFKKGSLKKLEKYVIEIERANNNITNIYYGTNHAGELVIEKKNNKLYRILKTRERSKRFVAHFKTYFKFKTNVKRGKGVAYELSTPSKNVFVKAFKHFIFIKFKLNLSYTINKKQD
jgi:hypothetical protein